MFQEVIVVMFSKNGDMVTLSQEEKEIIEMEN